MDGVILSGVIRPYTSLLTTKQNGNFMKPHCSVIYGSWIFDSPYVQLFVFHNILPHLRRINSYSFCRWFAKRFLHPDVMAIYDFIFLWDEDLGVENFNPRRCAWCSFSHSTHCGTQFYHIVIQVLNISHFQRRSINLIIILFCAIALVIIKH